MATNNKTNEKPWWWPVLIDDDYLRSLRENYPEDTAGKDDEDLLYIYDDGKAPGEYSTTWDHVGDAYDEYKELADAFLKLCKESGKEPEDFLGERNS